MCINESVKKVKLCMFTILIKTLFQLKNLKTIYRKLLILITFHVLRSLSDFNDFFQI